MANGQVVTNAARAAASAYFAGLSTWFGVGTGTTTPTNADTALQTEVTTAALGGAGTYTRPANTASQVTTTVANDTFQTVATWTNPAGSANTIAVTESGIFTALSGGTMYFHAVFSAINVAPGFGITGTQQVVFG